MVKKEIKRLYKSRTNKVFSGVLGGVGDYFEIDPVLVRVIYVLVTGFTGFALGLVTYIVMALIVPEKE